MSKKQKLKIIPLGGLHEIGKNMTAFEFGDEIVLIDCGMAFPDEEMFGVDLVIPDTTYLVKNKEKIKAILLTHGHEDHIGALPYFLRKVNVPLYGTRLTLGLVEHKLKEHGILSITKLNRIHAGDTVNVGRHFKAEFIRVNHSVADSVAIALTTPAGIVVHTGDFKIDTTPIEGEMINLARFGELGSKGVLLLMSDSTNAERPGYTMSERSVGQQFDKIFAGTRKRILIATFASNIHRVQQIINAAVKNHRKVAISGRSMLNNVEVASLLGYMDIPEGTMIAIDDIDKYRDHQIVIVTTGSQGETLSALARIARNDHRKVEIRKNDMVIISANPIPGNEKAVSNVINELFEAGAEVIYESLAEVHVSGHARQEELKLILGLTKPRYFMPVHGEYRHLVQHGRLGELMGVNPKNIFLLKNGDVLELNAQSAQIAGSVPSGQVMVDGYGVGDVGNVVLRDRKHLSEDGLIVLVCTIAAQSGKVVAGPDIISRGFVYVKESEDLMDELRKIALNAVNKARTQNPKADWNTLKNAMKNAVSDFIYDQTKRKPMILPVIMEV